EQPLAPQALGLRKRDFDVGHLDVEGHVSGVVRGRGRGDAAADADAFRIGVAFTGDGSIAKRVVGLDVPVEQLCVIALQTCALLPDALEMHAWLSHQCLLSRAGVTFMFRSSARRCPAAPSLVAAAPSSGTAFGSACCFVRIVNTATTAPAARIAPPVT